MARNRLLQDEVLQRDWQREIGRQHRPELLQQSDEMLWKKAVLQVRQR